MRISKRIREIERLIPKGSIIADIGCDHAYLDCLAVRNGRAIKSYACDVAKGPLENAKRTIQEMNCKDNVFPVLSNGLDGVPNDADVCVISGMGFETIRQILENHDLSQFKKLILQSNCDVYDLRKWLISQNLKITDEKMVHEGHFYTILVVEKGNDSYTEEDYIFGKYLNDEIFRDYWTFRKERLERIMAGMKHKDKIYKLQNMISMINQRL